MAAGYLPKPGRVVDNLEIGPCVKPCKHIDCSQIRQMAAMCCHRCNKEIGYETPFFNINGNLVHESCELDTIKKE